MVRGAAGVLHPAVAEGELARLACTSPLPSPPVPAPAGHRLTCVRGAVDTGHRGRGGGAGGRGGGGGRGRGGGRSLARVAWSLFLS